VVGPIVGYAIGYIIGALLYIPVKNLTDSKIDGTEEIYGGIEDILLQGDDVGENMKQILRGLDDYMISSSVRFVRDFGIGVYNLFGSDYGKKLSAGQYWQPLENKTITQKEDGGYQIVGIDPQGVVLTAREGMNDDLFGTNAQDILIGRSGNNTIIGYGGNDHIEGRGDDDILIGGDGDDEIFGGGGNDVIYGDAGNDTIDGGIGDDIIVGGSGDDIIDGGRGNDRIQSEDGDDFVSGGEGDDIIVAGAGNDVVLGDAGNDVIFAEDGDDVIKGGAGNDEVDAGAGADIIFGEDGNDNLRGGDGDDEIYGGAGVDLVYGDNGNDIIDSGADNDLVFGGIGNDIIFGNDGDDALYGEIGNDYLIGAAGADRLDGFSGDDVIFGGRGDDVLSGGEGNDSFIFSLGDGEDVLDDADISGIDVVKILDVNSTQAILSKSGDDLILQFRNSIGEITTDKITIKNQFLENIKIDRLEFADGKKIELNSVAVGVGDVLTYATSVYENVDTAIQAEFALGYEDYFATAQDGVNHDSTFYENNYNNSADEEIANELLNDIGWRAVMAVFG
jgi:Ca2+-binding RTX toxin-like protein